MLENFISVFGPKFYSMQIASQKVTIRKSPLKISGKLAFGSSIVVPFMANETINWQIQT